MNGQPVESLSEDPGASTAEALATAISSHALSLHAALDRLADRVDVLSRIAQTLAETLRAGHKVMVAGNGGSAAEAQHFAAELVGRFRRERRPLAALALTTDTSILTAIGNDYSFDEVFSRQVKALGQPGDLLIAFSTSGESRNLVRAVDAARERGVKSVGVTGPASSSLERGADITLRIPADDTATVQEIQMMLTHLLCGLAEEIACADDRVTGAGPR